MTKRTPTFADLIERHKSAHLRETGEVLSIRDIADELCVSHGTIYNILNGQHEPTEVTIAKIAKGLGVSYARVERAIEQTLLT